MALPRESALLPSIKCSLCGNQVEISKMGEHICDVAIAELSPPPEDDEVFPSRGSKPQQPKYNRTPPPLETNLAGDVYMHRGQLTPISHPSYSRDNSPVHQERHFGPQESKHTFRSPKHSQESWGERTPVTSSRRPGGYGGFDASDPSISETLMDRLNTTTAGPYGVSGRQSPIIDARSGRKESSDRWTPPPEEHIRPPMPRKDGYEGFGPPRNFDSSSQRMMSRSETYPKLPPQAIYQQDRAPSAPVSRPASRSASRPAHSRAGSSFGHQHKRSTGPDTSRKPPPRVSLLSEHRSRNPGSVDLAAEFGIGNPYCSPDDASSGYFDFGSRVQTTSYSSSTGSHSYRADASWERGNAVPSTEQTKPKDIRIDATVAISHRNVSRTIESPYGNSPRDDRLVGASPLSKRSPPSAAGYGSSNSSDHGHAYRSDYKNSMPLAPPSRGDCKACGVAITGKSISSADGRLTGKYHKACFVCSTCREPFSSSVFYVLNDKPYCERHYHKLNKSLCGACERGIEGQFAEDEAKIKYHVGCFRCLDCGASLANGYFDIGGYAYCERDAWNRVQSQAHAEQQDSYRAGNFRGAVADRTAKGLPVPPPIPPEPYGGKPSAFSKGSAKAGRQASSSDQRLRMNKRMTRLGNMGSSSGPMI